MLDIVSRLLENDGLHHKRSSLVQSFQNLLTLFVQHIMNTSVVDVASTHLDGSFYSSIVYQRKQIIQTSYYGCRIVIELEKIGRLPIHDFILTRHKATN